jgi:NADPH2:quinone reductase
MRAVQITQYGGTEQLSLNLIAMPTPGPGEVLVKIAFAGVNFMDVYTRRGAYAGSSPYASELPLTLGMEGSGWIDALGEGVEGFTPGDRVVFCLSRGSYADYAVVAADKLVLLPNTVGLDVAATAYFQGLTAHYLAYDTSRLKPDDTCLI